MSPQRLSLESALRSALKNLPIEIVHDEVLGSCKHEDLSVYDSKKVAKPILSDDSLTKTTPLTSLSHLNIDWSGISVHVHPGASDIIHSQEIELRKVKEELIQKERVVSKRRRRCSLS